MTQATPDGASATVGCRPQHLQLAKATTQMELRLPLETTTTPAYNPTITTMMSR